MKKFAILIIVCIFALVSCTNQYDAQFAVSKEFPNAEVLLIEPYKFIVVDSTSIHYVKCMSMRDGRITYKQLVKKWQNQ